MAVFQLPSSSCGGLLHGRLIDRADHGEHAEVGAVELVVELLRVGERDLFQFGELLFAGRAVLRHRLWR